MIYRSLQLVGGVEFTAVEELSSHRDFTSFIRSIVSTLGHYGLWNIQVNWSFVFRGVPLSN